VKDDGVYHAHILQAIERIESYIGAGGHTFHEDTKTQDAVIRNLQIIGEAAKKISPETQARSPDVPWRDIAGLRDRVVHHYFGVSLDIVWDVVVKSPAGASTWHEEAPRRLLNPLSSL
jgi:uncharacterized protein with HEPN domain